MKEVIKALKVELKTLAKRSKTIQAAIGKLVGTVKARKPRVQKAKAEKPAVARKAKAEKPETVAA